MEGKSLITSPPVHGSDDDGEKARKEVCFLYSKVKRALKKRSHIPTHAELFGY